VTEHRKENILVVGATGFLGPPLVEELCRAGFQVTCGVRNIQKALKQLPSPTLTFIQIDLNHDTSPEIWLRRLQDQNIDRVVNNVGIATTLGGQSLNRVNVLAPLALFQAMQQHLRTRHASDQQPGLPRIIQISTTGADWPDYTQFPYPASKAELDRQLALLTDLNYRIVRPNVIYEPERGHLLLEQIARLPINFSVGNAKIQPVHCREIAIGVARLFTHDTGTGNRILRACGPTPMTWKEIFTTAAKALGKDFVFSCSVPLVFAQQVTRVIQMLPEKLLVRFGILSKMDPETIVMMTRGSTGSNTDWLAATGLQAIHLKECYRHYRKGPEAYLEFINTTRCS